MGDVFRETLSEEEEEDFRLEGTKVRHSSPRGTVRWGRGHPVYRAPWAPSGKSADQVEDGTPTVSADGRVTSKKGV